jgi:Flp pilus assembly protein TadG
MSLTIQLRKFLRQAAREDGASAVEFAVSCIILFALLFGICQMSLAMYYYQFTSHAARQATRWAMVRGSTSCTNTKDLAKCNASVDDIKSYVGGLGLTGATSGSINVTPVWCSASSTTPKTWSSCANTTSNAPGNLVKVTVSYPLSFKIPFIPSAKSMSLTLTSTSQMVISQ